MVSYRWRSPLAYKNLLKRPGEHGAVFAPCRGLLLDILEIGVTKLVVLIDCTMELV